MSKKENKVVILTSHFPYYPGEQFLEEEILYWGQYFTGEAIIIPLNPSGAPRKLPNNIRLQSLSKRKSKGAKFRFALKALFSSLFIKEIFFLVIIRKQVNFSLLKIAYISVYEVLFLTSLFKGSLANYLVKGVTVYTYWNNMVSLAIAQLKKSKKYKITLISRAHRYEVYEEFKPYQYMPLKRQFSGGFDKVLSISEEGKTYLQHKYKMQNVTIARLGVDVSNSVFNPGNRSEIIVLSLSNCTSIKRIDRIIRAIYTYASQNPQNRIKWHHIGDGVEFATLKDLSERLLNLPNVKWQMHGNKSNTEVHDFLTNNNIDVFVNASESEGVPVSIMEAMSYGIPAIAPDIGGIKELVLPDNGILLSSSPTECELVLALEKTSFYRNKEIRYAAKKHVESRFNSAHNYKRLVEIFNS